MSRRADDLANRIIGARIVSVEEVGDTLVQIEFEHRGTDDDSGWITLPQDHIRFAAVGRPGAPTHTDTETA
jgi:hypothetical protein